MKMGLWYCEGTDTQTVRGGEVKRGVIIWIKQVYFFYCVWVWMRECYGVFLHVWLRVYRRKDASSYKGKNTDI